MISVSKILNIKCIVYLEQLSAWHGREIIEAKIQAVYIYKIRYLHYMLHHINLFVAAMLGGLVNIRATSHTRQEP